MYSLRHRQHPHCGGPFVTVDERVHHYHPKSLIYDCSLSLGVPSTGLDKCIHHYSVIYSIHCPEKSSMHCLFFLSPLQLLIFTVSIVLLPFPECHLVGIIECVPFQIGFFHVIIRSGVFSMSSPGFIAHFLSVLNNIPWFGFTSFSPFTH